MDVIIRRSIVLLFLVFLFFSTQNYFILCLGMNNIMICKQSERTALLSFKQHLDDPSDSLSSWSGDNCCRWAGVVCSNTTDHVVQLQLQQLGLGGEQLNPSLQELKQLRHLDLSWNNFDGISIPGFLGSLQSLRYLNLSSAGFIGMIPHQLGNLSNLRYLDLSNSSDLYVVDNFQWISHLSSLKHLDLSEVNLKNASSDWFHVVSMLPSLLVLRLSRCSLSGALPTSLPYVNNFISLAVLDLSSNKLNSTLPEWLYGLTNLEQLVLSENSFRGTISASIGNLTKLTLLDLSYNYQGGIPMTEQIFCKLKKCKGLTTLALLDFQWISHLSSLKHLDLSEVNLENASSDWFHVVNMLPSLLVLRLSRCSLSGALPTTTTTTSLLSSPQQVNFTSLEVLQLSDNKLNSTLPEWLYSLTNLQQLDLSVNSFHGTISPSIGNLTKLTLLDLSRNQLIEGKIPTTMGNLCNLRRLDLSLNKLTGEILGSSIGCIARSLEYLDLSYNQHLSGPLPDQLGRLQNLVYLSLTENSFSGCIPFSIGSLTSLTHLDLSGNELNGSVPESFGNLSKLETLFLSYNSLVGNVSAGLFSTLTRLQEITLDSVVLKVSPEWIPPFQLKIAKLRNCGLGPRFPNWIQTQKLLENLDLSSNGISGSVPTWFWNLSSQFNYLNLSHNHFNGELPKVLKSSPFTIGIYLSSNQFKGPLPHLDSGVVELDLSNNSFSGPISAFLCNPLAEQNYLRVLDLSNNILSGDLSDCWVHWTFLNLVWLGNNYITGEIPSSMGSLPSLQSLHLQNNYLTGELPLSLRNCTSLVTVDIGENVLTGRLPIWLGESLMGLIVLRLRGNKFHGEIPQKLCDMTSLQILDLAHNNLSGSIPRCFNNLSAMATKQNSSGQIYSSSSEGGIVELILLLTRGLFKYRRTRQTYSSSSEGEYAETTSLVTKGREFEYSNTLRLVTSMDLSKNSLSGEIPKELTSLVGLRFFNLSENRFTGKIPEKIGNMSLLESLDLSNNSLSGVIPQSISGISSLSHLNLSYNNLSGKIPSSTQLQSFNEYSFIGNRDLCGDPLNKCNGEEPTQKPPGDDGGDRADEDEEDWFELKWFYMSMGVGFAVGFWAFWGVMVLKRSWRIAYFRFLDDMKDKICLPF